MEDESSFLTLDTAAVVKAEDCEHCLFLGDLSAFCTEEILHKEFESFGNIISLQIARSKSNHKSLLYGFLTFEESFSAVKALNSMNHKIICGRAIKIRWANLSKDGSPLNKTEEQEQKTFCLKVSNVDISCDEELFSSLFSSYEHLVSIQWKHFPSRNGQHLKYPKGAKAPYVLVLYSNASSAAKAMRELDGKVFGKTVLQIQWATNAATSKKHDQEEKKLKLAEKLAKQSVSIYLTFVGMTADILVTEEMLRDVFGSYGPIDDVAIRLTLTDTITHVQKGYAFVYYEASPAGMEGALRAQHDFVVDKEVQHVFYHVELSKRLKSRLGMNDDHGGGGEPLSSSGEDSERSDEQKEESSSSSYPSPRTDPPYHLQHHHHHHHHHHRSPPAVHHRISPPSSGTGARAAPGGKGYPPPASRPAPYATTHSSQMMMMNGYDHPGTGSGTATGMAGPAVPVFGYFPTPTATASYPPLPVLPHAPRLPAYANYPPFYATTPAGVPPPPPPPPHPYSTSSSTSSPGPMDHQHHHHHHHPLAHPGMTPFYPAAAGGGSGGGGGAVTASYPPIYATPPPPFLALPSPHYPNYHPSHLNPHPNHLNPNPNPNPNYRHHNSPNSHPNHANPSRYTHSSSHVTL